MFRLADLNHIQLVFVSGLFTCLPQQTPVVTSCNSFNRQVQLVRSTTDVLPDKLFCLPLPVSALTDLYESKHGIAKDASPRVGNVAKPPPLHGRKLNVARLGVPLLVLPIQVSRVMRRSICRARAKNRVLERPNFTTPERAIRRDRGT